MSNSFRYRLCGCALLVLQLLALAPVAPAAMTVEGYTPETAGMYDRFLNDPSFIGSQFNWSGVGRGLNGTWGTMISPSFFISANHFNPADTGNTTLRFYYTNNPNGQFEDHTFTTVGQIPGGDLWIGKLTTPVSNNVAKYPVVSLPSIDSYANIPILTFGISSDFPGTATTVRLGTNNIDAHAAVGDNLPPVVHVSDSGTDGFAYTFDFNPAAGNGESWLQVGDSGGPNFYLVGGTMPALVGINWFQLDDPNGSGSTFVPHYLTGLQAALAGESLSIVTDPAVKGDFNLDGKLSAADIQAMLGALTDLAGYKLLHGITDDYLLKIGDLNGDNAVTNADIQAELDLVAASAAVSLTAVPEPPALVLAVLAAAGVFIACRRRKAAALQLTA
jgi:hypothetical protein